tara:strand:+ start:2333 stop:3091 length:759 start_codon:yes stop_codon:yes gene_type:complete
MYYVYEIPGIKVGCTNNLKRRVEIQQGYEKYSVLFKSEDIKTASEAEKYYQELLNYKVDAHTYEELINNNNNNKKKTMLTTKTKQSTTFKVSKEKLTKKFMLDLIILEDINGTDVTINEELAKWMVSNLQSSQYNDEMYLYNNALVKRFKEIERNKNNFDNIRDWAKNKGILDKGDIKTQSLKLYEEAGELARAVINNDRAEIIDAIGDIVVVLTSVAYFADTSIEECIEAAYNEIKDRKGKMSNGSFVKSK